MWMTQRSASSTKLFVTSPIIMGSDVSTYLRLHIMIYIICISLYGIMISFHQHWCLGHSLHSNSNVTARPRAASRHWYRSPLVQEEQRFKAPCKLWPELRVDLAKINDLSLNLNSMLCNWQCWDWTALILPCCSVLASSGGAASLSSAVSPSVAVKKYEKIWNSSCTLEQATRAETIREFHHLWVFLPHGQTTYFQYLYTNRLNFSKNRNKILSVSHMGFHPQCLH